LLIPAFVPRPIIYFATISFNNS
ncbi:uncharacterized protein METZ01_LOCUS153791, partial [marine metagenome]